MLAALLATGTAFAGGCGGGADPVPTTTTAAKVGPEVNEAFIEAWERHRRSTYLATGTFRRVTAVGGEILTPASVAQRPPLRVAVQMGTVDARGAGGSQQCTGVSEGSLECTPQAAAADYEAEVAAEVAAWRSYFVGSPPLYLVARGDAPGCFELIIGTVVPNAPYGDRAELCFDEETGGLRRLLIEREAGTDELEMTTMSAHVDDADLAIPEPNDVGVAPAD